MNVQRLTLDLNKSSVPRGRVTIAQCDHDGTTVEAEIYDNGVALSTSGLSAYLVMRLPDGRHYYRVPATLDGHVATALMDEAYAATVVGTTEIAYFELVGSGEVVYSTSRFAVRVLPSATAGATVPETWDGEVERLIQQLDDAIETATDAANVANAAAANADATVDGVESRVQEMAQDAAETATADAEQRIQDAIDAMGDISELAVPLMSADVRGGAKLDEHGGLVLRDEKLGIGSLVQESDGAVRGGIAGLTAKGHAEQDGTPTPESPVEIQVVRGRNLLELTGRVARPTTYLSPTDAKTMDGTGYWSCISADGYVRTYTTGVQIQDENVRLISTLTGYGVGFEAKLKTGETYCVTYEVTTDGDVIQIGFSDNEGKDIGHTQNLASGASFTVPSNCGCCVVILRPITLNNVATYSKIQLTLGSTLQPYVPYGHVGMEARNPDTDELISCTPIPLPSQGWVGSLPDGTADVLTLDGAGKVQWELKDAETTTAATDGITGTVGVDVLSTTGQIADGAMVLYKLATPVTEDCGYVEDWPTDLPEGAVVTIPELDAVGIRYFVDSAVTELARQWYARANSEYADRITALEQAVAELATS